MILFDELARAVIDEGEFSALICGAGHFHHTNLHNAAIPDMRFQNGKPHDVGARIDAENGLVVERFGRHGGLFFQC